MADSTETLCPRCGAPITPPSAVRSQRCPYCRVVLSPASGVWRPQNPDEDDSFGDSRELRFWLDGHRYAVIGRLARGEGSDVFLARRDEAMTARVIVKVPRLHRSADLFAHEEAVLASLATSTAQGAPHFTRLMPERVAFGNARLGSNGLDGERLVAIRRWRPGFVHTLADVRRAHGDALDPAHGVWIWKRVLESIGFVHAAGWIHGAVLPQHLLVNVRDHGVALAGFSRAARAGETLRAITREARGFCPDDVGAVSTRTDLAMSARAVLWLLGGDPLRAPARVPPPLARLLETTAITPWASEAWALVEDASNVARDVFGPPTFVPLTMP